MRLGRAIAAGVLLIACGGCLTTSDPDASDTIDGGDTTDSKSDGSGPAPEVCNLQDDDLDGMIDEGCQTKPNLRADESWLDLGAVYLPGGLGPAPVKAFTLPMLNMGVVLVARDVGGGNSAYVWAESLTGPDGTKFLTPGAWDLSANRAWPSLGRATALIGMAPQVVPSPGVWKFSFTRSVQMPLQYSGSATPGWLYLGMIGRTALAGMEPLKLDVDIFVVGNTAGGAAKLSVSPQWKAIAGQVNAIWGPAKIQLGKVSFFDVSGDDGQKYLYVDDVSSAGAANEMAGLFETVGKLRPTSTAVAVAVVSGIYDMGQPVALGLSHLAGVPGMAGARSSGLVISIDPQQWTKDQSAPAGQSIAATVWGTTLAHELGHFMGLWHTDEFDGALTDPIDDTPGCTISASVLTPALCPQQAQNLMFWSPAAANLSKGQVTVTRRHPAAGL
jgi:hypothetical protein